MSEGNEISRRYQGPSEDNPLVPSWLQNEPVYSHWPATPKLLIAPTYSFDEKEADRCAQEWGMNCGPAALAAMLALKPDDVHAHIPDFDRKHYTSPTMMKSALASLGVSFTDAEGGHICAQLSCPDCSRSRLFPVYGLARIQFEGPWLNPGVPKVASYAYTHWVGAMLDGASVRALYIFDVNCGWRPYWEWRDKTMPELTKSYKRATGGWHVTHRWQLLV